MTIADRPVRNVPATDVDPFGPDVREDPLPFHAALREAGPVVHLRAHDVYAFARYEQVHAALVDWQGFQSAAGVGLSNFRKEKPWRPPSLLLEADPPRHDAPRRVLSSILGPRALRRLRERWAADAQVLVDEVLDGLGDEFDAVPALAEAFPLRVFPDAVGLPDEGRENLLPYGDHLFNAFGPANDLVEKGAPRVAELCAWANSRCARDVLADGRVRRRHLGGRRPRRHHPRAGAAGGALAALGRRRHHGARALGGAPRVRHAPGAVGPPAGTPGAGRASRSTRRCAGSHRCRPSSAPPPATSTWPVSIPDGHKILMFLARPTATRGAGATTPTCSTSPATRPGTSGSGSGSTSASVSTWPGWSRSHCSPHWPAGGDHRARRAAVRLHNNTMRAWLAAGPRAPRG